MRFVIIATTSALAVLATTLVGHAQNNQTPSATSKNNTAQQETFWPTPEQEAQIPYRPCTIALGWVNRRLICRNY